LKARLDSDWQACENLLLGDKKNQSMRQ